MKKESRLRLRGFQERRICLRDFLPLAAAVILSLTAIFLFRHAYYKTFVIPAEDCLPADGKISAFIDSVSVSEDGKYLLIAGWAYDAELYTGYNYGTGRKIATVANNTSYALTDGESVYLLPTVARGRDDMSLAHPDAEVDGGAMRRYGMLSILKLGANALWDWEGMEIAVISKRGDGSLLLYDTGEKVPS